jgi:hypothetical protein
MASSTLIFAVALMLETGIAPANPRAASTQVFIAPPAYSDSIECQRMAMAFNKAIGMGFKGHPGGPYNGAKGTIMGAWCVVAPIQTGAQK